MEHYAALISVTPRKQVTNNPGRPSNQRFLFHPDHPLYDSHEQQIRSKPHIPLFIGRPPRPPGRRPSPMTEAWKKKARRFARYFLILLRPWAEANGQLPGPLTWKHLCFFIRELRDGHSNSGPTFVGTITLHLLQNIAQGLRVNSQDAGAALDYRARNATVWTRPDSTSALSNSGSTPFDGADDDKDPNYDKEKERTLSLEAMFTIKQLREQAAMDDMMDVKLFKRLKYLNEIAQALTLIFEQLQQEGFPLKEHLQSGRQDETKLNDHPTVFFLPHFASKAANLAKRLSKDPKTQLPQPSDLQLGNIKPSVRKDRAGGSALTSRDITAMSSKLNTKQLEVWTLFDEYFRELSRYREGNGREPKPPRIFVHGGPGTGKTFLINAITANLEHHGFTQSSCALTGVASGNLPDRQMMHKTEKNRLCVDLNKHDCPPRVNYHSIFVSLFRVKTSKHLAIFPFPPDQNGLQHLLNLKPPRNLILWLKSYDQTGTFQQKRLHDQLTKAVIKDRKGKRLKKTQTPVSSCPKRCKTK